MMESVRVEYELEPEDWGAFAQYCASRSRSFQRAILTVRLLGALTFIVAAISFVAVPTAQRAAIAAILAATWWWVAPRLMYRNVRRAALTRERPCLRGRHALELNANGIHAKCDVTESLHAWAGVRSVATGSAHVFILIGESLGYTVPRGRVVSGNLDDLVKAVSERARVDA